MTKVRKINYMTGDQVILKLRHKQTGTNNGASNVIVNTDNNEQLTKNNLACMKIAYLNINGNINGLRNKIDLLKVELSDYDIICIPETKLSDTVETSNLEIDGFNQPIIRDRRFNNCGGLLVYIKKKKQKKKNICFRRCPDIENEYVENIWIRVNSLNIISCLEFFTDRPTVL